MHALTQSPCHTGIRHFTQFFVIHITSLATSLTVFVIKENVFCIKTVLLQKTVTYAAKLQPESA